MSLYCGIDLHSNNNVICDIDDKDHRVFQQNLDNHPKLTIRALSKYKKRLEAIAVESTFNWYWLVDAFMEAGFQVELVRIGRINTLFSLLHQEKKDINDAVRPGASEI